MERDVYSGFLNLIGEEDKNTILAASNYAASLGHLKRYAEVRSLLRRTMPVARRVLGESYELTLKMRWMYGKALYRDTGATLDDLHEAVTTFEDTQRIARRVFGSEHPLTEDYEQELQDARAALRAGEGDVESVREAFLAMTLERVRRARKTK